MRSAGSAGPEPRRRAVLIRGPAPIATAATLPRGRAGHAGKREPHRRYRRPRARYAPERRAATASPPGAPTLPTDLQRALPWGVQRNICTQGLRGTQSTISIEAVSVEHVAAALGQKGPRVTRRAYLAPGA